MKKYNLKKIGYNHENNNVILLVLLIIGIISLSIIDSRYLFSSGINASNYFLAYAMGYIITIAGIGILLAINNDILG